MNTYPSDKREGKGHIHLQNTCKVTKSTHFRNTSPVLLQFIFWRYLAEAHTDGFPLVLSKAVGNEAATAWAKPESWQLPETYIHIQSGFTFIQHTYLHSTTREIFLNLYKAHTQLSPHHQKGFISGKQMANTHVHQYSVHYATSST